MQHDLIRILRPISLVLDSDSQNRNSIFLVQKATIIMLDSISIYSFFFL